MPADRISQSPETDDLLDLVRSIGEKELETRVRDFEDEGRFPREVFTLLGEAGLLGLPYPEEVGGGGLPFEAYLQVLEEIAYRWSSVGVGVSVHVLSAYPVFHRGDDTQRRELLPRLLAGDLLGAYSLSEAQAGSDPAAMRATATPVPGGYRLSGSKAWVTHGGQADYYTIFARTSADRRGISCFVVDAGTPGLSALPAERKMGLTGSTTAGLALDDVFVPAERRIGAEGDGLGIALSALDSGRLGIASIAVGLAQRALDDAVAYARQRQAFGKVIIDHQGLGFVLADMAAAVESARATTLSAARRRDLGLPFGRQASIAKLVATDAAMKVTTDAVQVLGGVGYTRDFPVERYMREAKVMQIFEGTNQIQRFVIARALADG
jgi:alkylation response protein AidB-like acyl-CoA dehydrogenase